MSTFLERYIDILRLGYNASRNIQNISVGVDQLKPIQAILNLSDSPISNTEKFMSSNMIS